MSERASESVPWSLREALAERGGAMQVSERASEPVSSSLREALAERSEAMR